MSMNEEEFASFLWALENTGLAWAVDDLRARDTAQREALARVEAERDAVRSAMRRQSERHDELLSMLELVTNQRDTAQAQLAKAVGLLEKVTRTTGWDLRDAPVVTMVHDFLVPHREAAFVKAKGARHAQGHSDGPEFGDGPEFEGWAERSGVAQAEQQEAQSPMAKIAEGLRQKAADEWANHPSNPANQEAQGAQAGGERAAFEGDPAFVGMNFSRAESHPEYYDSPFVNGAWEGWQARAALATQPAVPAEVERLSSENAELKASVERLEATVQDERQLRAKVGRIAHYLNEFASGRSTFSRIQEINDAIQGVSNGN